MSDKAIWSILYNSMLALDLNIYGKELSEVQDCPQSKSETYDNEQICYDYDPQFLWPLQKGKPRSYEEAEQKTADS